MKRKMILVGLSLIILIVISYYIFFNDSSKIDSECYKNYFYTFQKDTGLSESEIRIEEFRCSRDCVPSGFQVEVSGVRMRQGFEEPFYYHSILGGMASSGADSYVETCFILDYSEITSEIRKGRFLNYTSPARCSWQEDCNTSY